MTDTLHPDLIAAAALIREVGIAPPLPEDGVAGARRQSDAVSDFVTRDSVALDDERLLSFAGPHGSIPAKLYLPDGGQACPLLFYLHGGGFRQGSLHGWDGALRRLVRSSDVGILSIDYRLAPEHPFPIAFEETLAVMRAVIADGAVDGTPISAFAAGGDSGGANLALAAALSLRDQGVDALRYLLLFYGVYSTDLAAPSWGRLSGAFGLSVPQMHEVWQGYLPDAAAVDWRVEPIKADLAGLPPARVIVGNLDPLLDENVALDAKLRAAGVASRLTVVPGYNHGGIRLAEVAPMIADLIDAEGLALAAAFTPAG